MCILSCSWVFCLSRLDNKVKFDGKDLPNYLFIAYLCTENKIVVIRASENISK